MWPIYSGAAALVLSVAAMFFLGRPIDPVWRDKASLAAGAVVAIVVCVAALGAGAKPLIAWPAVIFWGIGVVQGTHLVKCARAGRTSASQ